MSINNPVGKQYLRCTKRLDNKSCAGCGKIHTAEMEKVVYQQMVKKLAIKILEKSPGKRIDSLSFFCYDTSINRIIALIGKSTPRELSQRAFVGGWKRGRQEWGEVRPGAMGRPREAASVPK